MRVINFEIIKQTITLGTGRGTKYVNVPSLDDVQRLKVFGYDAKLENIAPRNGVNGMVDIRTAYAAA